MDCINILISFKQLHNSHFCNTLTLVYVSFSVSCSYFFLHIFKLYGKLWKFWNSHKPHKHRLNCSKTTSTSKIVNSNLVLVSGRLNWSKIHLLDHFFKSINKNLYSECFVFCLQKRQFHIVIDSAEWNKSNSSLSESTFYSL